ncbi:hypothetical protein HYFRA_00010277 [Hymenoscyphus fraxineus]|uniref:Metallo-beta-lactamase domain-containing protein n=1 Tax=Hymenoscyphus fraxineus TaxID=746836 RepID=A0A9N9KZ48_9HELO|nr:hypothetical protein HYFRA_00010277 [Hymenoscyphus fraxineus]
MATTNPLQIPASQNTVKVQAINTTLALSIRSENFFDPIIPGHEYYNCPSMAFLITSTSLNPETGKAEERKIMFDAGARKDYWNYSPMIVDRFRRGVNVRGMIVERGLDEILASGGVELKSVEAVIWSHWHFDHIGDMSTFPPSTRIIVGPGFSKAKLPGYPSDPDSSLLETDYASHELVELDFLNSIKIGNFQAHDYFPTSPGSLYLLSVPGHAIGHMCALARTTPDTFLLLGADVCHFAGELRPSASIPLPLSLDPVREGLDPYFHGRGMCPCTMFTDYHPGGSEEEKRTTPYYRVSRSEGSAYTDPDVANESVGKIRDFDADARVFVCLAHDPSLFDFLPLFNDGGIEGASLNDWKKEGWKEKCRWGFLNELPRDGKPGRKPIIDGFWRGGEKMSAEEALRKDGE